MDEMGLRASDEYLDEALRNFDTDMSGPHAFAQH